MFNVCRRSEGAVGAAASRLVGGGVVGHRLADPFSLDPTEVDVDLLLGAGLVPAEDGGDEGCRGRGGGDAAVPGLDGDPGPPGEDVGEVQRALVGGRVDDLRLEV